MRRAAIAVSCALFAAACGGGPEARAPAARGGDATRRLVEAVREEAVGDPARAAAAYLDALDLAAKDGGPWGLAVAEASLDALVARDVEWLAEATPSAALFFRLPEAPRGGAIAPRVTAVAGDGPGGAKGPFVRGLAARALERIALHRGDASDAERWREATGCAREAAVLGPLA